jgi:hypothetical protein
MKIRYFVFFLPSITTGWYDSLQRWSVYAPTGGCWAPSVHVYMCVVCHTISLQRSRVTPYRWADRTRFWHSLLLTAAELQPRRKTCRFGAFATSWGGWAPSLLQDTIYWTGWLSVGTVLEMQIVAQKPLAVYGTRRFIAMFTGARH